MKNVRFLSFLSLIWFEYICGKYIMKMNTYFPNKEMYFLIKKKK